MPIAAINGIRLHFDEYGSGEPVVLITGTGAGGRVWKPHQVPALIAAGYRVITVDNRGTASSGTCLEGFTIDDMTADTAGLIEFLRIDPCHVIGFSLGAIIVQELLVVYPELVKWAVLMATRGRADALCSAISAAEIELCDSGVTIPARYDAIMRAMQNLSPRTLGNEQKIRDWLDVFEMSPSNLSAHRMQLGLEVIENRLESYRKIKSPCLVLGFKDDMVAPPYLCREVADSIPDAIYEEIAGCGHYGYLEEPAAVNSSIISFLGNIRE